MIITTYYYTLLQQLLLHFYFIPVDINCWLILPPCCKTRGKMLVFDRPSIFPPYPCISILQSTIQPPLPFDTNAYCLVVGRKTHGYARYSLLLYFPLLLCLISRCSRRWSPGAEDPQCLLRHRVPLLTKSTL